MGRSVPTARQVMEDLSRDIMRMAHIMQPGDAEILEHMIMLGKKHSAEISYSGIDPNIGFVLSILMELYRKSCKEG